MPMPPDFLIRCTGCEREAVWDTEAVPPVGVPEIGHPVLWRCETCGGEQRHIVAKLCVIRDKLHHEICLATEIDRCTVDRVMAELCRYRKDTCEAGIEKPHARSTRLTTSRVPPAWLRSSCWKLPTLRPPGCGDAATAPNNPAVLDTLPSPVEAGTRSAREGLRPPWPPALSAPRSFP